MLSIKSLKGGGLQLGAHWQDLQLRNILLASEILELCQNEMQEGDSIWDRSHTVFWIWFLPSVCHNYPFLVQEKAFLEHVIFLYSPSQMLRFTLQSLYCSLVSTAAVAKAKWWGHYCRKGSNIFQNKSKKLRCIKCSQPAACVESLRCSFFAFLSLIFIFFLRCSLSFSERS